MWWQTSSPSKNRRVSRSSTLRQKSLTRTWKSARLVGARRASRQSRWRPAVNPDSDITAWKWSERGHSRARRKTRHSGERPSQRRSPVRCSMPLFRRGLWRCLVAKDSLPGRSCPSVWLQRFACLQATIWMSWTPWRWVERSCPTAKWRRILPRPIRTNHQQQLLRPVARKDQRFQRRSRYLIGRYDSRHCLLSRHSVSAHLSQIFPNFFFLEGEHASSFSKRLLHPTQTESTIILFLILGGRGEGSAHVFAGFFLLELYHNDPGRFIAEPSWVVDNRCFSI